MKKAIKMLFAVLLAAILVLVATIYASADEQQDNGTDRETVKTIIISEAVPQPGETIETISQPYLRYISQNGDIDPSVVEISSTWLEESDAYSTIPFSAFENGKTYVESITIHLPDDYLVSDDIQATYNNMPVRVFFDEETNLISLTVFHSNFGYDAVYCVLSYNLNPTFDTSLNANDVLADQNILQGNYALTPIDPKANGYKFDGWYKDAAYATPFDFDAERIFTDTIIYAKWTPTIASINIEVPSVYASESAEIPQILTWEDCNMYAIGWYLSPDDSSPYSGALMAGETYYLKMSAAEKDGALPFAEDGLKVYVSGNDTDYVRSGATVTFFSPIQVIEPPHTHTMEEITGTPASCTEQGTATYYQCSGCGEKYLDVQGLQPLTDDNAVIPATGHAFGDWAVQTPATCETAGEEIRVCGNDPSHTETRPIEALGHDFSEWETVTPAACEAPGLERRICSRDASHFEERQIEALGHDFGEWTVATPATCEAPGVERRTCSRDASHFEERPIEALGHDYGEWKVVIAAGCETEGLERRVCKRDASHVEERVIPALGHEYGDWTVTQNATCETAGKESRTCIRDASHKEERSIPALGHDYGEWQIKIQPTCLQQGQSVRVCKNDPSHKETAALAKTNHRWSAWTTTLNPTETNNGQMSRKCMICQSEEYQVIPPLQHTHVLEYKAAVEAKCETSGNIAYYQCRECQKIFSDPDGRNEISSVWVNSYGHSWGSWRVVRNATTTSEGLRERSCTRCGKVESEAIPKLDAVEYEKYTIDNPPLSWQKGGTDLRITSAAPGARLIGVYINGKVVSVTNYVNIRPADIQAGTDLTLKAVFLNELDAGEHGLELRYTNGSASATLQIKDAPLPSPTPVPSPSVSPTASAQVSPTVTPTTQRAETVKRHSAIGAVLAILAILSVLVGCVVWILHKNGKLKELSRGKKPSGKHSAK